MIATTNLMPDELAEQMGRRVLTTVAGDRDRKPGGERTVVADEASELLGRRIVSRLVEMCGDPLPLYGEDRRREFRMLVAHPVEQLVAQVAHR